MQCRIKYNAMDKSQRDFIQTSDKSLAMILSLSLQDIYIFSLDIRITFECVKYDGNVRQNSIEYLIVHGSYKDETRMFLSEIEHTSTHPLTENTRLLSCSS